MLLHLEAGHPPYGRVVSVGTNHVRRLDRLASGHDPLAPRHRVAARHLIECRDLCADRLADGRERLQPMLPEDLELLSAEGLLHRPLQVALADDEEVGMLR